jgi:hypothetical protein
VSVKIQIVGLGNGEPTPFDGKYLVEYDPSRAGMDPEGNEMVAHIVATEDPAQAKEFATLEEALETWRLA